MDSKRVVFYIVLAVVAALLWAVVRNKPVPVNGNYSQFLQQVEAGQVNNAVVMAESSGVNRIDYNLKDGTSVHAVLPSDYRDALRTMRQKMVNIEIRDASRQSFRIAANSMPFFILLGIWAFMLPRMKNRHAK